MTILNRVTDDVEASQYDLDAVSTFQDVLQFAWGGDPDKTMKYASNISSVLVRLALHRQMYLKRAGIL